ncbi:MAG: AzlD domain-containing protein [Thermovirgaceae bacterium]
MRFYILFGAVALTFLLVKGLFLCFIPHGKLPSFVERTFRYIPPAVLAALAAPSIIFEKAAEPSLSFPRITAGIIAFFIALKTRSITLTIISGMVVLWCLSYFSG